jgi:putative MFS transporter
MRGSNTLRGSDNFDPLTEEAKSMATIDTMLDSANLRGFLRRLTILSAAGMFLDGFDLTVIAVALPLLVKQWHIGAAMTGLVAASAVIGMLAGSLVLGHLTDRLGRRAMYLFDLIFFVVFAVLTALSQNVWELLIFRFLLGIGIGADYPISSTLLSEFSPPKTRGRFLTLLSVIWFVGSVAAYLVGSALLPLGAQGWRWMLVIGAAIAVVVILFRSSIPESPRWLVNQGRNTDASAVLTHLSGRSIALPEHPSQSSPWLQLFAKTLWKSTVFVCGFWFAYDVAYYGISIYTPTILKPFIQGSQSGADFGAAIISLVGVAGALLGVILVDRWGRRPLILLGFGGLTTALVILSLTHDPAFSLLLILFSAAILFGNFSGILDFVYATELFPTGLRAGASGLGTAVSRVGAILSIVVFPSLVKSWGLQHALWLFSGAGLLGFLVSLLMAPETKGRSLEAITPIPVVIRSLQQESERL